MNRHNWDYDHDLYDDEEPFEVKQLNKKLDNVRTFFTFMLCELTNTTRPLDIDAVQNCISEMSGYLDVDDRSFGELAIERKAS